MGQSSGNSSLQEMQKEQQQALTRGGQKIDQAFQQFNPQFYKGVEGAYENQQLPLLNQQFRDTHRQLDYKLANQGIAQSSAAKTLGSSLNTEMARNQQQVVNQAQQASQDLQSRVAQQKASLYSQLQTSQNPTSVAQAAAGLAAQTGAPSTFQPIGQMFNHWSNMYLANQVANAPNPALYNPYLTSTAFGGGSLPKPQY